ncbi:S-adenosylmethionine decarboxylase [Schizopora paradoxa]|uniref:S-adenosylmethionine decarboxylase n=1 Tax=Schizopora paradoxa TaxID=27342 RepID=A0A0H2S5G4_9AGAM|nr:S-adenosylmethionine decarboxylase [Schizopora paradoxa]
MACEEDTSAALCPFEGPEKLLEIWFAPSPAFVPDANTAPKGRSGLLAVDRKVWEDMLDIVKCKVLSVIYGDEMDAYLLSESSFFVSPHRLILKTCGTTLNLLGLPRILSIAKTHAKLSKVYQCFYSRKSFMFPDKQLGPHKDWSMEVQYLDRIFDNGSAYTVGKVNGDHWLLYMTSPLGLHSGSNTEVSSLASSMVSLQDDNWAIVGQGGLYNLPCLPPTQDYTIEILMTHLSARARAAFFAPPSVDPCGTGEDSPSSHAQRISNEIGISDIFPKERTHLDAYAFTPCGYSSNALISLPHADGDDDVEFSAPPQACEAKKKGEGYYTIHVTPEEGWSYASFECNVPLAPKSPVRSSRASAMPDLRTLVQRVVRIFEPGKITLTLFISSAENASASEDDGGETAVDAAQRAFKAALTRPSCGGNSNSLLDTTHREDGPLRTADVPRYKRTDKINYEFGGYDLAFASFELI